jgi:hypothetical protein
VDKMNAAVVTSFDDPPRYQEFEVPQPRTDEEIPPSWRCLPSGPTAAVR